MRTTLRTRIMASLLIGLTSSALFAAGAPTPVEQFATLLSESADWSAFMQLPALSKENKKVEKLANMPGKGIQTGVRLTGFSHKIDVIMQGDANHPTNIELSTANTELSLKKFMMQQLPTAKYRIIADQCEEASVSDKPSIFIELTLLNGKKVFLKDAVTYFSSSHGDFSAQTYSFTATRPVEEIKINECKRVKA